MQSGSSAPQRNNQSKRRTLGKTFGKAMLVLCLSLALGSIPARAEEISVPSEPQNRTSGEWYGWQILLSDTAAIGLLVGGGFLTGNSSSFAFVPIAGGVLYYSGGPLIHVAHFVSGAARGSFLRRLLVPLVPAAVGVGIGAAVGSSSSNADCGKGCAAFLLGAGGFGLGMLGAMGYDWVTATEPAKPSADALGDTGWTPMLAVGGRGLGVGLAMRF
jgi:hypothetical protein